MPQLQLIQSAASEQSRVSTNNTRANDTSAPSIPRRPRHPPLAHVHSHHLDDSSIYHDPYYGDREGEGAENDELNGDTDIEKEQRRVYEDPSEAETLDDQAEFSEPSDLEKESSGTPEPSAQHVTTEPAVIRPISEKSKPRAPGLKKKQSSKSDKDRNLVTWDGPDDPTNPKNWSTKRKWVATFVVSSFTFISPVSSSMVAPALNSIATEFGITNEVESQMVLSVFVLAYGVGPLFFGPLSELYGRVHVLQLANLFYLIFNAACGGARNKSELIAFRFLAGLGGSAPLAIGGGVLSDAWRADQRGAAISVYSLMPLLGPAIGPIAGGFITENTTWRWAFYATSIADALIQLIGLFFLQETYPPTILHNKAKRLRKETGNQDLHTEYEHMELSIWQHISPAIVRPFKLLGTQTMVQVLAVYMAYLYGLMYLLLSTFPLVWNGLYQEPIGTGSLNFISLGIGFTLGTQVCARLQDTIYRRLSKRNNGVGKPEFRILLMIPASFLIPIGLFIYGWAAQYKTQWIVPNIGAAIFAFGSIMCYQAIQTFLVDAYTRYAASAIGAVTVLRSVAGFGFPLFAPSMYDKLGLGWGNSTLAFIAIVIGVPSPILLWKYGERLRERSPFAAGGGF